MAMATGAASGAAAAVAGASVEQLVAQTLQAATNPSHEIVQKAEAQLREWEQQPGFFPTIARLSMRRGGGGGEGVSSTEDSEVKVRWMAAVYLKNGVERYWRPNSRQELPAEQKQQIREVLLRHYDAEEVPQVALQIAVLLGRLARTDYPRFWPELLPTLMKQLQSCSTDGDSALQQRILIVLHYVLKALASRRLMAEQRAFEELGSQIFAYLAWDIWAPLTTRFLQLVRKEQAMALNALQRAYVVMRSLRKLVVYGCAKPYKSTDHMNFVEQLFQRLRQCLELRYELKMGSATPGTATILTELERFVIKMMKTLNELMERHSVSFARFVPVALEFSFHYVFHEGTALIFDAGDRINFKNFAIQALNMLKGIMLSGNDSISAPPEGGASIEDELLASAAQSHAKFFTAERVTYICEKIVTHYFLLTQQELEEWQQDPEGYDFLPGSLSPNIFSSLFEALFLLLHEAGECDTKIVVLGTMTLLVEKMSEYIEPQALQFIAYLPLLWRESEEYDLLRCAIIGTLEQLVRTIRDVPEPMKPFLYSVIELSTDLQQHSHVYLIEDGIMLWLAVIGNSTALTPELLALCDHLLPIIEMSSENLRTVLQLIHAYILLDAQAYLSRYGEGFVAYCVRSFEDIRVEGIIAMLRIFETCLKTDAAMGLRLVRPALPFVFQQVCLKQEYPMTMGWYLTIVARTLLIDQSVFMSVVQQLPQADALARILDVWIEMFPMVPDTHAEKRKLFCLAFASIFGSNELLLARLPHILQLVDETLGEVMDKQYAATDEGASKTTPRFYDSLVIHDEHELDELQQQLGSGGGVSEDFHTKGYPAKTYHDDRHRQLVLKDPVYKIPLTEYLKWQLQSLQAQLGSQRYEQVMCSVVPEVLERITMYIEQTVPKACVVCAGSGSGSGSGAPADETLSEQVESG
ncbi:uncharacterized protein Dyak_GE11724 [Drosophila yakuba]|uniref:Importin N-terminal domain-containing protein n=1 Tax=Drosophila yakuba TaxID=7245 RepID=B4P7A5_DROYA|nr:uncharacterized protein Dyak_GE11724 [Drosophila yakuba]